MFSAIRVARPLARSVYKNSALRSFASSARARDDHGHTVLPQIYGPGSKPGEVPTDELQSTGLERLQVLGEMQGVNVFDKSPLDSTRVGTKANPIIVTSLDNERLVGCTGSPADSHDIRWFRLTDQRQERCTECGSVHQLEVQGLAAEHH